MLQALKCLLVAAVDFLELFSQKYSYSLVFREQRGLVPEPSQIPKICKAQVPDIKWHHITYAHAPVYWKYLQVTYNILIRCKSYINSCYTVVLVSIVLYCCIVTVYCFYSGIFSISGQLSPQMQSLQIWRDGCIIKFHRFRISRGKLVTIDVK